jgi:dTDP-glucose pyrophosphorylase
MNNNIVNVLIPMAGSGSRFLDAGYSLPKPIIDVGGAPMIKRVIESLNMPEAHYIFIVQKEHYENYGLLYELSSIVNSLSIVVVDGRTEGAASTTLLAKDLIDNDAPLVIANSDQIVEWNSKAFQELLAQGNAVALFNSNDPKWSYAKIDNGIISEVAEKIVISDQATVGIYGWKAGAEYVKYAERMISKNIMTNGEFYICPVYNEAIKDGESVLPYFVDKMHGIGTPEDLEYYLENNFS